MPRSRKMGEVFGRATFSGPAGRRRTLRLLVDTGSTYSWLPTRLARYLGAVPQRRIGFEMANGREVWRPVGILDVAILGRRAPTVIVFGRRGDGSHLGLHALEGLTLYVDSARRRLRRGRKARA